MNGKAIETMTGEGFPAIKLHTTVKYMNKEISFCVGEPFGILSDEGMIFDADRHNGKGMHKGI